MRYTGSMRTYSLISLLLLAGGLLLSSPQVLAAPDAPKGAADVSKSLKAAAAKAAKAKGNKQAARQAKGLRLLAGQVENIAAGRVDVNHQSPEGLSALMVATALGHKGAMVWLIEQGANPLLKDAKGKDSFARLSKPALRAVLDEGSKPGDEELMELCSDWRTLPLEEELESLMQKGVSPYALNQSLRAAVVCWGGENHSRLIRYLLEKGARAQALLAPGRMAGLNPEGEYKVFDYQPFYKLIGRLYESGASGSNYGRVKALELLDVLLQQGLELRQILNTVVDEASGSTQLMMAAASNMNVEYRGPECLAWMLANGADPTVRNKEGKSALDILEGAKSESFADELPAKKALLGAEVPPSALNLALEAAVRNGAADCAGKLLDKGADIRTLKVHRDASANTHSVWGAMDMYSSRGTSDVFKAKREAKMVQFSYQSNHPLYPMLRDFALPGSRKVADLLAERAGDVLPELLNTLSGKRADATLLMAVAGVTAGLDDVCPPEALAWMLEYGADPGVKNEEGRTAYDICTDEEKKKLLKAAMEKAGK